MFETSAVYVEPLLVERLMFTLPTFPVVVHVTVTLLPTVQVSLPLGELTVIVAVGGVLDMVKFASDVSDGVPSVSETLIRHAEDNVEGTVTDCVPSFGVLAASVV